MLNKPSPYYSRGATLLELIVFLVIIGVALTAFLNIFTQSQAGAVDPLIRVRALELAQSQIDEVLARRFDENTPIGGVPACNAIGGATCLGIAPEAGFDDVGDFHNFSDSVSYPGYTIQIAVTEAGSDLGLPSNDQARLIRVSVTTPPTSTSGVSDTITLSAYKVNF